MGFASALLVMLMAAPFVFVGAQTTVDWTLGKSYASYATQPFTPGGTIVFNYATPTHNVLVVNKADYDSCNTGNPVQTFTDGKSTITLKQGPMYFICGTPTHCQSGMKLQLNVGSSSTPSSPATPTTPTSTTPSSSTTPTSTPSAPSPQDSSASGVLLGASHIVFAMVLGFGAFFALMS